MDNKICAFLNFFYWTIFISAIDKIKFCFALWKENIIVFYYLANICDSILNNIMFGNVITHLS